MQIHEFWGSDNEFSYGWTQTDDAIHSGDILATKDVVGFLAGAWPVAVTKECGEFHQPSGNGFDGAEWQPERANVFFAQWVAVQRGLELL